MSDIIPFRSGGEGGDSLKKVGEYSQNNYTDEIKSKAFRRALITSDVGIICVGKAHKVLNLTNRAVVFLCDSNDPFGHKYLRYFHSEDSIAESLLFNSLKHKTLKDLQLVCFAVDLQSVLENSLLLYRVILECLDGLLGYFPVVVCANEGYTVFPWPFNLKENTGVNVLVW